MTDTNKTPKELGQELLKLMKAGGDKNLLSVVDDYIQQGAALDEKDGDGMSLLTYCVEGQRYLNSARMSELDYFPSYMDIALSLIKSGAPIKDKIAGLNGKDTTFLHWMLAYPSDFMADYFMKVLKTKPKDLAEIVHLADGNGKTLLDWAKHCADYAPHSVYATQGLSAKYFKIIQELTILEKIPAPLKKPKTKPPSL